MNQFIPFIVDRPDLGFKKGSVYPGLFRADSLEVVVYNDEGKGVKFQATAVRIDTDHWRRRSRLDTVVSTEQIEERMLIAHECQELHTAAVEVKKGGPMTRVRERLLLSIRNILEVVDPAAASKNWDTEA